MATGVKCCCGWRGRRSYRPCEEHEGICSCTGYGRCPKCGYHVNSIENLRQASENAERAEKWLSSPAGKAALASIARL